MWVESVSKLPLKEQLEIKKKKEINWQEMLLKNSVFDSKAAIPESIIKDLL